VEVRTRAELLSLLGSRHALDRAVTTGAWQRVLRGAYVRGGAPADLTTRACAARLVLPPRALVADGSLLWLLGVDVLAQADDAQLEVVVARGAVVPARTGVRARTADLPRRDRATLHTTAGPVPVLRPVRALADLLRRLPLAQAVVVADAAQHAGLCDAGTVLDELTRHHGGLRGVRCAQRALELSDGRAESPQESRTRLLLVLAGLFPVPQLDVHDPHGRWVARVDLGFPAARVAVEYDGLLPHSGREAFVHDRRRQNLLLGAGWLVLRYTAADLRLRPELVVAQVRAALLRAA